MSTLPLALSPESALHFPQGLTLDAETRWRNEMGPAQQDWLSRVGGLRLSSITSEPELAAAMTEPSAQSSDVMFGLAYARLLDLMAWPLDVDATHPFLFLRVPQATPAHLALIETINARGISLLRELDDTDARYADSMPLLLSHSSRDLLVKMANQAPTNFAFGLSIGWLVLNDWRQPVSSTAAHPENEVLGA